MLTEFLPVKVHVDLLVNIVQFRTQNKHYQTNKLIKNLSFFYVLKSLTTSGIIKDYAKRLPELTTLLNCVNSTFYAHLKACKKMGLIAVNKGALILAGYSAVGECFDQLSTPLITIKYNPTKDKFHHLLEAAYIATLQKKQSDQFHAKVNRSPELVELYETTISIVKGSKKFAEPLHKYQVHAFIHGHKNYYELMAYNPDFQLSARKLRQEFNFKSNKSVAYLKKKLAAKGLLTVEKREYTSKVKSRLKHAYVTYNNKKQQTVWKLPDALVIAPSRILF